LHQVMSLQRVKNRVICAFAGASPPAIVEA
jgi:hypothetical protein